MIENQLYDKKSIRSVVGPRADFKELAKDCVAFANAQGGNIDIGIEDGSNEPPQNQKFPNGIETVIQNKLTSLASGISISTERIVAENGGEFIRLSIARSVSNVAMTSSGKTYIRIGDQSRPVGSEDFSRLAADKGALNWETTLTSFSWQNADSDKLKNLLSELRESDRISAFAKEKSDKELLDFYNLTDSESDSMTNLGVLFIGKQTQRSKLLCAPVIQCIKYDQYGEKVNKWLWDENRFNPKELINEVWTKIPEWAEGTEIADGMFRRNIPAYPEPVVRELLCNALVHRQYTIRGDIFINIYPDYIEVVNPGTLPLGVTETNILHTTKKRNEHMANLFYALHLMEREGSGYDMMYETLLANGKNVPKVIEGDDSVKVVVERRVINPECIKVMQLASTNFHIKQKPQICLGLLALHESLTASSLIKLLYLKDADMLRPWLHPLIDSGLVVVSNAKSKAKEYRVAPQLLKDSGYRGRTTLKRIEGYRVKELILEDLKIYGPCSLKDVQERIGAEISMRKIQFQAGKLVDEGVLNTIGEKRWTKYELCHLSHKNKKDASKTGV